MAREGDPGQSGFSIPADPGSTNTAFSTQRTHERKHE
jgi:hypothetical protein